MSKNHFIFILDLEAILESSQLVIGEVDTRPYAWQKRMENQ